MESSILQITNPPGWKNKIIRKRTKVKFMFNIFILVLMVFIAINLLPIDRIKLIIKKGFHSSLAIIIGLLFFI